MRVLYLGQISSEWSPPLLANSGNTKQFYHQCKFYRHLPYSNYRQLPIALGEGGLSCPNLADFRCRVKPECLEVTNQNTKWSHLSPVLLSSPWSQNRLCPFFAYEPFWHSFNFLLHVVSVANGLVRVDMACSGSKGALLSDHAITEVSQTKLRWSEIGGCIHFSRTHLTFKQGHLYNNISHVSSTETETVNARQINVLSGSSPAFMVLQWGLIISGVATGGGSRWAEYPLWQRKICHKIGKKRAKSGKGEKIGKKRQKSGRALYFAPPDT